MVLAAHLRSSEGRRRRSAAFSMAAPDLAGADTFDHARPRAGATPPTLLTGQEAVLGGIAKPPAPRPIDAAADVITADKAVILRVEVPS